MRSRLGSRSSRPMRLPYKPAVHSSRWLSVRGIAKITLALIAVYYFFISSHSPFADISRSRTPDGELHRPPNIPHSALEQSQNSESNVNNQGNAANLPNPVPPAPNDALVKEEEERKFKEEEERKIREQEEEERKQRKEEEERKLKAEEEAVKKQADDAKKQSEVKPPSDNTRDATIVLDKDKSGSTNQGPKNPNELTTTFVSGRRAQEIEHSAWVDDLLKDITHKRIYIVDDPTAELHLDQNKGRESMVYIKYILNFYDNLDDVTIFFHSSRFAWHNNVLHNGDGAVMINNLRRSWVVEKGYMNARCELWPGCPQWITWNASHEETKNHPDRFSDLYDAKLWDHLFPHRTRNPGFLSQPCCSQFAVSRDAIRSVPKEQYQRIHDWLGTTETNDGYAGRIMEYVWQYLFLDKDEHCPDMLECYCKGYGLCLKDPNQKKDLKRYNQLRQEVDDTMKRLGDWDTAHGCHDISPEKDEEIKNCKKDNIWEKPLALVRSEKMNLEGDMKKRFGVSKP